MAVYAALRLFHVPRAGATALLIFVLTPFVASIAGALDDTGLGPVLFVLVFPGVPMMARWLATIPDRSARRLEPPPPP